ncbi:MAG: hypothetical protein ACJ734_11915 [Gaiellaceae bacterium]
MKRKAIMFVTAVAASAISLSAAGCGGGSYSAAHRLYRFAGDVKPGETKGEGSHAFGARWEALARGKKIDPDD